MPSHASSSPAPSCPRRPSRPAEAQERIGEHHLLEQPERHQREAEAQLCAGGAPRLLELRHELGRSHDGPGDQVRKEGHEQRVIEEVASRHRAPQVYVEGVGHRGERVERDADRQHDIGRRRLVGDSEGIHRRGEVRLQEAAVLEVQQHAEIDDDRQEHPRAPAGLPLRAHQPLSRVPIDDRRYPQQDHERRIPRRVEQVAGDQEVDLAHRPRQRQRMHQQNEREECSKGQRIEYHAIPAYFLLQRSIDGGDGRVK